MREEKSGTFDDAFGSFRDPGRLASAWKTSFVVVVVVVVALLVASVLESSAGLGHIAFAGSSHWSRELKYLQEPLLVGRTGMSMAVGCEHSVSVMEQRINALQAGATTVPWVGQYKSAEGILAAESRQFMDVAADSAADIGMAVAGR